MLTVLRNLAQHGSVSDNSAVEKAVKDEVYTLTSQFPIYQKS